MDIKLWENDIPFYDASLQTGQNENAPSVTPYLLDGGGNRACVIVFPGGGYVKRAAHEGEPVALWLNSLGFNAFVLNYRIAPYKYPAPIADAQRAVRYVRHNAKIYGINPNKIGILGFSAGGHLACLTAALYSEIFYDIRNKTDETSARPDAAVLCYPVVSLVQHVHAGSVEALLGSGSGKTKEELSGEMIAHSDMPPIFIWHTAEDKSVPAEHTLMLVQALKTKNVPVDCHIYNNGAHGLGIGLGDKGKVPLTMGWMGACAEWLGYRLG
jgi:acetyl esterase/lipase